MHSNRTHPRLTIALIVAHLTLAVVAVPHVHAPSAQRSSVRQTETHAHPHLSTTCSICVLRASWQSGGIPAPEAHAAFTQTPAPACEDGRIPPPPAVRHAPPRGPPSA